MIFPSSGFLGGALGGLSGRLGGVLSRLEAILSVFERSGVVWRLSWAVLAGLLARLGALWGRPRAPESFGEAGPAAEWGPLGGISGGF